MKLAVVIGRFQPVHNAHIQQVLLPTYRECDQLLILIGSANRAPSPKNPWDPETRFRLIQEGLRENGCVDLTAQKLQYRELDDFSYNDSLWVAQVQKLVSEYQAALSVTHQKQVEVVLYGTEKDSSSYYVRMFPQWGLALGDVSTAQSSRSATDIRELLYAGSEDYVSSVPAAVSTFLRDWISTPQGQWTLNEAAFYSRYRKPYDDFREKTRHGYIAVTCDAIVWHKGRILLVKRGFHPGKGLWALPGGYLGEGEFPIDGAMRECREETRFRLSEEWLFAEKVYANPGRSLKGRTITHGFGFRVPDTGSQALSGAIQAIRGSDDAAEAAWVPINDILTLPEFRRGMFEDHWDIISDMIKAL